VKPTFQTDDGLGGNHDEHHQSTIVRRAGFGENLSMFDMYNRRTAARVESCPRTSQSQWCISSRIAGTRSNSIRRDVGGRNSTFTRNLFACNTGRNPRHRDEYDFNFVNNVLFNWRTGPWTRRQHSQYNIINNYLNQGP